MSNSKIPKGQYQIKRNSLGKVPWPILTAGNPVSIDLTNWELKVGGLVKEEKKFNWEEFNALAKTRIKADMHCVTKWTINDMEWEGIDFYEIVKMVKPKKEVISVEFKADDDVSYSTSIKFDSDKQLLYFENPILKESEYISDHSYLENGKIYFTKVILAIKANGENLSEDHGGPMRVIVPDLYAWKGTKFCNEICFKDKHDLGFWEQRGYSDTADPYTEDRYTIDVARKIKAEIYSRFKK